MLALSIKQHACAARRGAAPETGRHMGKEALDRHKFVRSFRALSQHAHGRPLIRASMCLLVSCSSLETRGLERQHICLPLTHTFAGHGHAVAASIAAGSRASDPRKQTSVRCRSKSVWRMLAAACPGSDASAAPHERSYPCNSGHPGCRSALVCSLSLSLVAFSCLFVSMLFEPALLSDRLFSARPRIMRDCSCKFHRITVCLDSC